MIASSRVSLKGRVGCWWQCLIPELVGRCSERCRWEALPRVSAWVSLVVSDRGCGWKVLWKVLREVLLRVSLKLSYAVLVAASDRRTGWEVSLPRSDGGGKVLRKVLRKV